MAHSAGMAHSTGMAHSARMARSARRKAHSANEVMAHSAGKKAHRPDKDVHEADEVVEATGPKEDDMTKKSLTAW